MSRDTEVACAAGVTESSKERRIGLLRHDKLDAGDGLLIAPCEAVHTFGMKFPIDIAFLDRKRRVLKVREAVGPRRIAVCLRAHSVLELPAGQLSATKTVAGDLLELSAV